MVSIFAASVLLLVCSRCTQGFLVRTLQPAPSFRCGYSVNDYLDNLNRKEGDDEKKSIGVSDYLPSLSRISCEGVDQPERTDGIRPIRPAGSRDGGGGMFDVQNKYFKSLGRSAAHNDKTETQQSSASEESDDGDTDGCDYADFLNFNIGSPDAATNASPWQMAAAVQEHHYRPTPKELRGMTYEEVVAFNNARLCPKMLVTQRAVQYFVNLCEEVRDPHSRKWLEDFLQLQNLGNFHGTGAFNITRYPCWDDVLYDVLRQPNEKMIVSAKQGGGHGGWAKNNPYLQERWVEFPIDIRPASLIQRLLPVRRQLAEEFVGHLRVMLTVDERIHSTYFKIMQDTGLHITTSFSKLSSNCLSSLTSYREDSSSSPLFWGNFDLLKNLCTQAAAHWLLRDLHSHSQGDPSHQWFIQFYSDNVPLHFDGNQPFGQADAFMDKLVSSPPVLALSPAGEPIGWSDPIWLAEQICSVRSEIAARWMSALDSVDKDELKLNDSLTRLMFERTIEISEERSVLGIEEDQSFGEMLDDAWE